MNPETYFTPGYLSWHFSYFITVFLLKTGHISQWIFLENIFAQKKKKRQIFLLFFGAMWLLILKLMLFQKQGGCKLIFASVWLCLSWLPNEEFKKVEIKFLEPKTVPKTWKYKASSSQHRIIKNIILSLSFSSHSFWIYVFFSQQHSFFPLERRFTFWGYHCGVSVRTKGTAM